MKTRIIRILLISVTVMLLLTAASCSVKKEESHSGGKKESSSSKETEESSGNIRMEIDGKEVKVKWEENSSTAELQELLEENPLNIEMSMYGGFEQVGDLGKSLSSNDRKTTTSSGDIVLYQDSSIVVFYGSNTWSYTRLGKITDPKGEELEKMLSGGDVTIKLETEEKE